jgi:hypothetical protein
VVIFNFALSCVLLVPLLLWVVPGEAMQATYALKVRHRGRREEEEREEASGEGRGGEGRRRGASEEGSGGGEEDRSEATARAATDGPRRG